MMKRTSHKILKGVAGQGGFSFVEIMVVVLISSFMIAGLYTILGTGKSSWEINRDRLEVQQEIRKGMDWMRRDLRQAGVTTITNVPANGTWYTTITFQTPSGVNAAGVATWNPAVTYSRGGTGNQQLLRTVGGVSRIISQDINTLQFRRTAADPNVISISVQAQKNTPQHGLISITVTSQERMRN